MNLDKAFNRGLLVGMLLVVGAHAIHWFLTPASHPDPGYIHTWMVVGQAIFGFGGALWVYLVHKASVVRLG